MLVLSRKIGERIFIGSGIEIAVVGVRGGRVQIGVAAPEEIRIRRTAPLEDSEYGNRPAGVEAATCSK